MLQRSKKVIGLTGFARSGKDTAASILVKHHGFRRVAFADPLKRGIAAMLGITVEELEETKDTAMVADKSLRYMLQTLGTDWGRQMVHDNLWVELARMEIEKWDRVVVTDVRFTNEVALISQLGGEVWAISRPNVGAVNSHVSDTGISTLPVDRLIRNDGSLKELEAKVLSAHADYDTRYGWC